MRKAWKEITLLKQYRRYRRKKDLVLRSWRRYDSGENPQSIVLNKRSSFRDIVLEFQEDFLSGVAFTIKRATTSRGRDENKLLYTHLTNLGQVVLYIPHKQMGVGKFAFGVTGISRKQIEELLQDLGVDVLTQGVDIPVWLEEIKGVAKHETVGHGEYMLL